MNVLISVFWSFSSWSEGACLGYVHPATLEFPTDQDVSIC